MIWSELSNQGKIWGPFVHSQAQNSHEYPHCGFIPRTTFLIFPDQTSQCTSFPESGDFMLGRENHIVTTKKDKMAYLTKYRLKLLKFFFNLSLYFPAKSSAYSTIGGTFSSLFSWLSWWLSSLIFLFLVIEEYVFSEMGKEKITQVVKIKLMSNVVALDRWP